MRALSLALLLALGCAKPYQELVPFGCPRTHLCPDGYACVSGKCDVAMPCTAGEAAQCTQSPERSRCTLVAVTATTFAGECVHTYGAVFQGGTGCELTYNGWQQDANSQVAIGQFFGDDRFCGAGSICHNNDMIPAIGIAGGPQSDPDTDCRTLCTAGSGCAAGSFCLDAFGRQVLPALQQIGVKSGVCTTACSYFGAGCGTGHACGPGPKLGTGSSAGMCHKDGSGVQGNHGEGQRCVGFDSCAAGLHCVPEAADFACRAICDSAHACAGAKSCDTSNAALGVGVCR